MDDQKINIWILEDDPATLESIERLLSEEGSVRGFPSLNSFDVAIRQAGLDKPDLVVADLALGDGNFLQWLRNHEDVETSFFVISSYDDDQILESAFELGAIDYLTKPFNRSEFRVKIKKALRSRSVQARGLVGLSVDPKTLAVRSKAQIGPSLTARECRILQTLIERHPQRVDRDVLFQEVWGGVAVVAKTLDVHLMNLRKKLVEIGYSIDFVRNEGWGLRPLKGWEDTEVPRPL
jgi:OmpR family two-component system response regulator YxdJ